LGETDVERILIIGFGTMGQGISKFFLRNDLKVDVLDHRMVDGKLERFISSLDREVAKGKMTTELRDKIVQNINVFDNMNLLQDKYYLCIEAIPEEKQEKINLYKELENHLDQETIIASNTSSIMISELSEAFKNRSRFLGLHFFNPADKMPLVEMSRTDETDPHKCEEVKSFLQILGKNVKEVKDSSGFIVNRILIKAINEACLVLEEGVSNVNDIDEAMKQGAGWPMGPFELADFIGIDVCLNILRNFQEYLGDVRISKIMDEKVERRELGRKTKKGFYNY